MFARDLIGVHPLYRTQGSRNIAAETFSGLLAARLGLYTPDFRIISVAAKLVMAAVSVGVCVEVCCRDVRTAGESVACLPGGAC